MQKSTGDCTGPTANQHCPSRRDESCLQTLKEDVLPSTMSGAQAKNQSCRVAKSSNFAQAESLYSFHRANIHERRPCSYICLGLAVSSRKHLKRTTPPCIDEYEARLFPLLLFLLALA